MVEHLFRHDRKSHGEQTPAGVRDARVPRRLARPICHIVAMFQLQQQLFRRRQSPRDSHADMLRDMNKELGTLSLASSIKERAFGMRSDHIEFPKLEEQGVGPNMSSNASGHSSATLRKRMRNYIYGRCKCSSSPGATIRNTKKRMRTATSRA